MEKVTKTLRRVPWEIWMMGLISACCLTIGLTRTPALYPVDFGQYERIMSACGLTWTEADLAAGDLQYSRPITTFAYTDISFFDQLSPRAGSSIVYPVLLIRLLTAPFGALFHTDILAAVWGLLLVMAVMLLTAGCLQILRQGWYIVPAFLCLIFLDGNFAAILRGLYPVSAAIVFGLMYIGLAICCAVRKTSGGILAAAVLCSCLFLKSMTAALVFLPAVIAVDLWMVIRFCRGRRVRILPLLFGGILLAAGIRGTVGQAAEDPDFFSDAASYESFFTTLLPVSEKPEEVLEAFGLDATYAADSGRSYYEDESAYAHNPRDRAEAKKIFTTVNASGLAGYYLTHPGTLAAALDSAAVKPEKGYENARNRSLTGSGTGFYSTRSADLLYWIRKLVYTQRSLWSLLCLVAALAGLACGIFRKKHRGAWLCGGIALACMAAYMPVCVMLNGHSQIAELALLQTLLNDMLLCGILVGIMAAAIPVMAWMTAYTEQPVEFSAVKRGEIPVIFPKAGVRARKIADAVSVVCARKGIVTAAVTVLCLAMLGFTFLRADHPGTVNNGDYARMMEQIDVTWTSDIYFNSAIQAQHGIIENYEYLAPFDPLKLTPLKPTYSLYWFAAPVRLITEPFGAPFSTLLLALVMGLITVGCISRIIWDLHPVLGKWTALTGLLLAMLFMSETSLTWYNSLFGEGSILCSLLMTATCAVHLCVNERERHWKTLLWYLGMVLSLYLLTTSKAQMLFALPGGLILLVGVAWYRRSHRYDLTAVEGLAVIGLCTILVISGIGVYQTDRTADSVSQKHTMWQAYFYGIFMISDDPVGDMEELGIDTAMAADIGKFVEFDKPEKYVYAPLSEEAQTAFYDHVDMMTIVKWYITHPLKLFRMLDYACSEARSLYTGFRVYYGEDYSDPNHSEVNGLNLWPAWRENLTPGTFLGYVLFYGVWLYILIRLFFRDKRGEKSRMVPIACLAVLSLLLLEILQLPLSVLGNGFADNQKQLFCFSLCQDLMLVMTLVAGFRRIGRMETEERQIRLQ